MTKAKTQPRQQNNNMKNTNSLTEPAHIIPMPNSSKLSAMLGYFPFSYFKTKDTVAVLRLEGVIGRGGNSFSKNSLNLASLNAMIEEIFAKNKLKALCLCINSPGGSPVQSELIADRIIKLSKQKNVPVYSFVEDIAASGGYWLACIGQKIFASKSSIIGSIGVISASFGFQEAIKKLGIERRIYTQGDSKSILDPFEAVKEADIAIIKKLQKEIHHHFIDFVKNRRQNRLTQDDAILFNGEFWSGTTALDYGLIDGIQDMYSFIFDNFGEDINIEYVEAKQSWFKKKLGVTVQANSPSYDQIAATITAEIADYAEQKLLYNKFNLE